MAQRERVTNNVAVYRKERAVTQEELGIAVNVTRQTILSIEKRNYVPSVLLALKIAAYFNAPIEKVFHYETF